MEIDSEYITVSLEEIKDTDLEKDLKEIIAHRRCEILEHQNLDESKKRLLQIKNKLPFFENCTDMELVNVVEKVNILKLEAGEKIFLEGEPTKSIYFVVSGNIEIHKNLSQHGEPKVIAHIVHNDVFGEIAYINQEPRTATAQVSKNSSAILISFNIKEKIPAGMEYVYMKIFHSFSKSLSKKLNKANLKMV